MSFFIKDINVFYLTIYGGIIIGVLFDLYKALRHNFKIVRKISLLFDIVFWIFITVIIFITVNYLEKFYLRYYHFIALFLGYILYYNTISRFIFKIFDKIISFITCLFKKTVNYIVGFLNNLYYILIYSIHFIFDIICYIASIFLRRKKKNKKGMGV